ncbi:MAG: phospholipid carrier-dependent glycosyltransferase [Candidatus Shapirobacteria bacterium]|jgi:hypothetical protein
MPSQKPKSRIALLIFCLVIGLALRLYRIDQPIADWHSHRQADTAAVTINLLNRLDLLHPRYFDISNVQSGKNNPMGYRFVEFPVYNLLSALFYTVAKPLYSPLTVEMASRLVSVIFSLLTSVCLYLLCFQLTRHFWPSLLSFATFLFLPFNIYYSRVILPEPTATFFMVLTVLVFSKNILLSSIPLALAFLTKPFTGIIIFPVLLFFVYTKSYLSTSTKFLRLVIFCLLSLIPFYLWRRWIANFPEGIPDSSWLFNGGNIRFRPAWFRWLFFERIGKLILGIYGIIPFSLGLAYRKNRSPLFVASNIVGVMLFLAIIARGNIQHDYYQTLIIPGLSIATGFGLYYFSQYVFNHRLISFVATITITLFSLAFSYYQVKEYYHINNPVIISAGNYFDQHFPSNAIAVAPYFGDTAFLYQTKRFGYPIEIYDVPELTKLHPNQDIYLISVNYDNYTNQMMSKYQAVYQTPQFIILDFKNEKK